MPNTHIYRAATNCPCTDIHRCNEKLPAEEQRVDFPERRILGQGNWPPSWRMERELHPIQAHLKEGNAGLGRAAIFLTVC